MRLNKADIDEISTRISEFLDKANCDSVCDLVVDFEAHAKTWVA